MVLISPDVSGTNKSPGSGDEERGMLYSSPVLKTETQSCRYHAGPGIGYSVVRTLEWVDLGTKIRL